MPTRIRLARAGAKKRPFYRVVVTDIRAPRDGKFIEKLGTFNPLLPKDHQERLILNEERVKYWLGTGATPTDRVEKFLVAAGLMKLSAKKAAILKKRTEKSQAEKAEKEAKLKAEADAKAKEEAEAAAAEAAAAAESAAEEAPKEEAPAAEEKPAEDAKPEASGEEGK